MLRKCGGTMRAAEKGIVSVRQILILLITAEKRLDGTGSNVDFFG